MNKILTKLYQKRANAIARKEGFGSATKIILGNEDRVISHVTCGYRKHSNGEYVSRAYYRVGFSSCYYQHAETTVMIKKVGL